MPTKDRVDGNRPHAKTLVKTDKIYIRQLKLQELLRPCIPESKLNAIIFGIEQLYNEEI
jgi:hypothetical protein